MISTKLSALANAMALYEAKFSREAGDQFEKEKYQALKTLFEKEVEYLKADAGISYSGGQSWNNWERSEGDQKVESLKRKAAQFVSNVQDINLLKAGMRAADRDHLPHMHKSEAERVREAIAEGVKKELPNAMRNEAERKRKLEELVAEERDLMNDLVLTDEQKQLMERHANKQKRLEEIRNQISGIDS